MDVYTYLWLGWIAAAVTWLLRAVLAVFLGWLSGHLLMGWWSL